MLPQFCDVTGSFKLVLLLWALLEWLATLDSSRTFIREKAVYSGTTGTASIMSKACYISLLYRIAFVNYTSHSLSFQQGSILSSREDSRAGSC